MVDIVGRAKIIVEAVVDTKSIDDSTGKLSAGLRKGAVIGAAALGTLAVGAVKVYKSFEDAEAQSRKLNQVLDNMGKSDAGPAVEALATKLSDLTAVDDDVIKQGETLLATFSNVASSAGDAGGVFERATAAAVDLAATGFGSVESASVMLGKALQDPVKGVSALGEAGVTFSEDQKKLIESFVATNDVASAQTLILKEVEKQVKGTAEATATESDKIAKEMGDLSDNLGALVADIVADGEDVGSFSDALHHLNDELENLDDSKSWASIRGAIRGIGHAIEFVADVGGGFLEFFYNAGEAFGNFMDDLQADLEKVPWLGRFVEDPRSKDVPGFGLLDPGGNLFLDLPAPGHKASGGPASGWNVVNEQGPELVHLPDGSYVYNAQQTKAMMQPAAGSSLSVVFNEYGPRTGADRVADIKWLSRFGPRMGAPTSAGV